MIIPDSQAHLNGHTIITFSYSIYNSRTLTLDEIMDKESKMHLDKNDDPDYMGFITIDTPGKSFSYTADGNVKLETGEVQEVIEQLSEYRDSPKGWSL